MVAIGFSEFTFGFAFLHEQANRYLGSLICAPVLPSLREEAGVGYDARLPTRGIDFYYQFKISEYLKRRTATYIQDGTYSGPYYRFWLDNSQHRTLFCLAQRKQYTFYVAPRISNKKDFDRAYLEKTVTVNSVHIPVHDCGAIRDSKTHCITFGDRGRDWILHSEPKKFQTAIDGKEFVELIQQSKQAWRPIDNKFADELLEEIVGLAEQTLEWKRSQYKKVIDSLFESNIAPTFKSKLSLTAEISSFFFGANLILVGEGEQQQEASIRGK